MGDRRPQSGSASRIASAWDMRVQARAARSWDFHTSLGCATRAGQSSRCECAGPRGQRVPREGTRHDTADHMGVWPLLVFPAHGITDEAHDVGSPESHRSDGSGARVRVGWWRPSSRPTAAAATAAESVDDRRVRKEGKKQTRHARRGGAALSGGHRDRRRPRRGQRGGHIGAVTRRCLGASRSHPAVEMLCNEWTE